MPFNHRTRAQHLTTFTWMITYHNPVVSPSTKNTCQTVLLSTPCSAPAFLSKPLASPFLSSTGSTSQHPVHLEPPWPSLRPSHYCPGWALAPGSPLLPSPSPVHRELSKTGFSRLWSVTKVVKVHLGHLLLYFYDCSTYSRGPQLPGYGPALSAGLLGTRLIMQ